MYIHTLVGTVSAIQKDVDMLEAGCVLGDNQHTNAIVTLLALI